MSDVNLPAVIGSTLPVLDQLTKVLGVPRDTLASDEEIQTAWGNLPGVLKKIPPALRTEGMVRMCVAVSAGLFDSAINYIWNASVIELRFIQAELAGCSGNTNALSEFKGFLTEFRRVLLAWLFGG